MSTTNLLDETKKMLMANHKSVHDVSYVILDASTWCTWDEFEDVADIEYDSGYGLPNVPESLKVVGSDWWLERWEYDGSEGWEFKTRPEKRGDHVAPDSLKV